jgi:hypothetical protein
MQLDQAGSAKQSARCERFLNRSVDSVQSLHGVPIRRITLSLIRPTGRPHPRLPPSSPREGVYIPSLGVAGGGLGRGPVDDARGAYCEPMPTLQNTIQTTDLRGGYLALPERDSLRSSTTIWQRWCRGHGNAARPLWSVGWPEHAFLKHPASTWSLRRSSSCEGHPVTALVQEGAGFGHMPTLSSIFHMPQNDCRVSRS